MKDINKFFKQEWESCLWNYEKHTRRKWFSNSPIRKGKRVIEFIKSAVQEIFKSNNFSCELCPSVQKKETGRKKKKKLGQHPSPRSFQPRFIFKRYFSDETDSEQGTREDFCCEKIHGRVSWDGATTPFPFFLYSSLRNQLLWWIQPVGTLPTSAIAVSESFRPKFEYSFPRRMSPSVYITPHLYFTRTSGCRPPSDRVFVIQAIVSFDLVGDFYFFSTLFICVARIERSECKKYICKKKILEPKV